MTLVLPSYTTSRMKKLVSDPVASDSIRELIRPQWCSTQPIQLISVRFVPLHLTGKLTLLVESAVQSLQPNEATTFLSKLIRNWEKIEDGSLKPEQLVKNGEGCSIHACHLLRPLTIESSAHLKSFRKTCLAGRERCSEDGQVAHSFRQGCESVTRVTSCHHQWKVGGASSR